MSTGVIELLAMLGLLSEKERGGGGSEPGPPGPPGPPAPYVAPGELPALPGDLPPPPVPGAGPPAMPVPVGPLAPPGALPPLPPWPTTPVPAGLPSFPGPGWVPDMPVTSAVAARAAYWNPSLWNYPTKTIRKPYVQELLGGQWVTFAAAWHPGSAGPHTYMATEAWRLKAAPPIAPPSPGPVAPSGQPWPVVPSPTSRPAPVGAEPRPGAWQTDPTFIHRYQAALSYLSTMFGFPKWNPGVLDGRFGPNTSNAVKAFQSDQRLSPVDGKVGNATAAALDKAMGYGAGPGMPSIMPPDAPVGPPGVPHAGAPPPVSPYPAPGAYKTAPSYITRYQNALTWLAQLGHPAWDPGGVDGKYGPKTVAAVKAFQRDMSLPADGMAGAATAAALDHAMALQQAAA